MRLFNLTITAGALFLFVPRPAPAWRPAHGTATAASNAESAVRFEPGSREKPKRPPADKVGTIRHDLALAARLESAGAEASDRGDLADAAKCHRGAARIRQRWAPASLDLAESLNHLGQVEEKLGELGTAEANERAALRIRNRLAPASLLVAGSLHDLARVEMDRTDLAGAERDLESSLILQQRLAPPSNDLALNLIGLANLYGRRGDLNRQQQYFDQASAVEDKLTPLSRASIAEGLGTIRLQRGELGEAEQYFRKALDLRQAILPDGLAVAISLSDLGNLASNRGDPDQAEQDFRRALAIRQRIAPRSLAVATSFGELAAMAQLRGNLALAEQYLRTAWKIERRLAPQGLSAAGTLQQLGIVCWLREDYAKSQSYIEQATAIRARLAPRSAGMAQSLDWLGMISLHRGDLEQAESYFREALGIAEELSSEGLLTAQVLGNLGDVAQRRNRLEQAQEYYLRAHGIQQKIAPDSPGGTFLLQKLGDLARKRNDVPASETYYRRALVIRESKMPGSSAHANLLLTLASLVHQQHRNDEAAQLYERAFRILDLQMIDLGGDRAVRSVFRARYETAYQDYIDLLVREQRQPQLAFDVVERSRARTLLELLASAHVHLQAGMDPELLRRERGLRESISAKSSRRLELLNQPHPESAVASLDQQIAQLSDRYDEIREQIQSESPGYAALEQPRPLTAEQVQQQLLDPDTLLLEFSLGERRSYVWAVSKTALEVHLLPARKRIEDASRKMYGLLTSRSQRLAHETMRQRRLRLAEADRDYTKAAIELSDMILAPVARSLERRRLLVASEGALQYIPLAALPEPRPEPSAGSGPEDPAIRPLVLDHEVLNLPSASTLAELRRARNNRRDPAKAVAVFADPVFDRSDERVVGSDSRTAGDTRPTGSLPPAGARPAFRSERLTRLVSDVGLDRGRVEFLGRLLWTQREAAAILKVAPPGQTMEAVGFNATRARALDPSLSEFRIVHFATHALLDSKNPERSGLVFSLLDPRGRPQNGFVDLEQIYNLKLPVQLVVLSACDTALGEEVRGEGLVGLARGFMYAGASRVMASLWSVDDEVTSELMAHFYRAVERDRMSPAAALRAAQIAVAKDRRWNAPYYWAGFQIQGEWQ